MATNMVSQFTLAATSIGIGTRASPSHRTIRQLASFTESTSIPYLWQYSYGLRRALDKYQVAFEQW